MTSYAMTVKLAADRIVQAAKSIERDAGLLKKAAKYGSRARCVAWLERCRELRQEIINCLEQIEAPRLSQDDVAQRRRNYKNKYNRDKRAAAREAKHANPK
jgi:hypothetical protein